MVFSIVVFGAVSLVTVTAMAGIPVDMGVVVLTPAKVWFYYVVFLLCLAVLSYMYIRLKYHFYRYELTDTGFKKELGILSKRYVSIPYDRIQNIDIRRGWLARLMGLSSLQIHTAGVGGVSTGEGILPALSKEVAEQLRDEVLDRARNSRSGQGL